MGQGWGWWEVRINVRESERNRVRMEKPFDLRSEGTTGENK